MSRTQTKIDNEFELFYFENIDKSTCFKKVVILLFNSKHFALLYS